MAITTTIGKSHVVTGKLGLGTNKVGGHNLFRIYMMKTDLRL